MLIQGNRERERDREKERERERILFPSLGVPPSGAALGSGSHWFPLFYEGPRSLALGRLPLGPALSEGPALAPIPLVPALCEG